MGDDVTGLLRKVAAAPRLAPPLVGGTRRYELGRRLGAGQFGEVFVARDREHGGAVALKVLRGRDGDWVHRFKGEFRHVADLAHANLARLYELFEENGSWFLTMELVEGIAFDEHLARLPGQIDSCFGQLASALHALHSAGVLHRDVKPSNALVEATGRVVLVDFGLAYGMANTELRVLAGTPLFMAPEQWSGELGEATDWYAFGTMLYMHLASRAPFEGRGAALLQAKLGGPAPLEAPPGLEHLAELALRLLHPEPTERPEYREVAAAFRVASTSGARALDRWSFVGRGAELERMHAVARRRADGPVCIAVRGEAGIGKTALARTFLDAVKQSGAALYGGRCHETESTPFKGLDGAVDMLCADLARLDELEVAARLPRDGESLLEMFPVLKRVHAFRAARADTQVRSPHARRASAFGALRELLGKMAAERMLCLFLDDVQWAGEDTIELLLALLAAPAPPLVLVMTARTGATSDAGLFERIASLDGVRWESIELQPLGHDDVSALVAQRPDLPIDGRVAWLESAGHPYLLSRMLVGGAGSGAITANLRESIAALSPDARALLEVISLEAEPLTQAAAFGAAGVDGWRADVVDELRRQRLARTSLVRPDAIIEPYHDRVRETLLGSLSAEQLRERHRALASYLEEHRRASSHSLAHHYREAGSVDHARRWIRLAAQDAVRGLAFVRADELYRQAVHLASGDARVDLRIEWANAMVLSGRRAHAAQIYMDAAAGAEEEGRIDEAAELRTRAGEHWILAGDFHRGIELIERALGAAGVDFPRDGAGAIGLALQVAGELVQRGFDFVERPESALTTHELRSLDVILTTARALMLTDLRATCAANLALREALRLGERRRVQRALCYFVQSSAASAPELPFFVDAVARAYALAELDDDDVGRAWAVASDGMRYMQAGNFRNAWSLLRAAERRLWSCDPPMTREAGGMRILLLACAAVEGVDLPFALRVVDGWLADAASRDDHFVTNWLRIVGSRVKLIAGDVAGAARHAALARAQWSEFDDDMFAATVIAVEMGLELYKAPSGAHEIGRVLSGRLSRMFVSAAPLAKAVFYVYYASALAAAGAAGRIGDAECVERLEGVVPEFSGHNYDASAIDAIRAHQAMRRGDRSAAAAHMHLAARGWTESGQPLFALSAQLRHAQLVRDQPQIEAHLGEMLALGVGDPERYATLIAGPAPH